MFRGGVEGASRVVPSDVVVVVGGEGSGGTSSSSVAVAVVVDDDIGANRLRDLSAQ